MLTLEDIQPIWGAYIDGSMRLSSDDTQNRLCKTLIAYVVEDWISIQDRSAGDRESRNFDRWIDVDAFKESLAGFRSAIEYLEGIQCLRIDSLSVKGLNGENPQKGSKIKVIFLTHHAEHYVPYDLKNRVQQAIIHQGAILLCGLRKVTLVQPSENGPSLINNSGFFLSASAPEQREENGGARSAYP